MLYAVCTRTDAEREIDICYMQYVVGLTQREIRTESDCGRWICAYTENEGGREGRREREREGEEGGRPVGA